MTFTPSSGEVGLTGALPAASFTGVAPDFRCPRTGRLGYVDGVAARLALSIAFPLSCASGSAPPRGFLIALPELIKILI
jgi:hypothetical protein